MEAIPSAFPNDRYQHPLDSTLRRAFRRMEEQRPLVEPGA